MRLWTSVTGPKVKHSVFKPDSKVTDVPTSVSWLDSSSFVVGYSLSENICVFDVNKSYPVHIYPQQNKSGTVHHGSQPNRVRCSQNLIITGHESRNVKVYDRRKAGKINEFVAHSDSVTGICVDHLSHHLFTCGHDGNVRVWDIRTYKCLNDLKVGGVDY